MPGLLQIIDIAIRILIYLIIARVILSWIPSLSWRYREISRWIENVTNPLLRPFQRILPPRSTGGLDLSPLLAIFALSIVRRILFQILIGGGIRWS